MNKFDKKALEKHNVGISADNLWLEKGTEYYIMQYFDTSTKIEVHGFVKSDIHLWSCNGSSFYTLDEAFDLGEHLVRSRLRNNIAIALRLNLISKEELDV